MTVFFRIFRVFFFVELFMRILPNFFSRFLGDLMINLVGLFLCGYLRKCPWKMDQDVVERGFNMSNLLFLMSFIDIFPTASALCLIRSVSIHFRDILTTAQQHILSVMCHMLKLKHMEFQRSMCHFHSLSRNSHSNRWM